METGQEGPQNYNDYFDIMVIGQTGLGKTTTMDKLLLANPTQCVYIYSPQPAAAAAAEDGSKSHEAAATASPPQGANNDSIHYNDLTMWKTSCKQDYIGRLKNLVFIRDTTNTPHKQINIDRKNSMTTKTCELISNDTSKVRVLDVPGFFSSSTGSSQGDLHGHANEVVSNNLAIMRKILHIKAALHFKFDRIVYFLPEKGVLRRESEILKMEIKLMENLFGTSIFGPMAVVATQDQSVYDFAPPSTDFYPPECMTITKENFQKVVSTIFLENAPNPPIIFLSYLDSCEEVLAKLKDSKVSTTGVNLAFSESVCIRCNINIKRARSRSSQNRTQLERNADSICSNPNTHDTIPYDESTCHPMFIPKYTKVDRIMGSIVRIISFGQASTERWPWFWCGDEKCIECGGPPGSTGCKKVASVWAHRGGTIKVDHSHHVQECYVIEEN